MDERDAIQKTGSMGIWGLESGPPLPPIFGNAGGGTGGEMDLKVRWTELWIRCKRAKPNKWPHASE